MSHWITVNRAENRARPTNNHQRPNGQKRARVRNKEDEMVSKFAQDMSKQVNALTQERDQLHTALVAIRCIAMGRDGQSDAEGLGALVDELYTIASKAVAPFALAKEQAEGSAFKAYQSERDQLRADLTIMTNRLRIARDEAAGLQEQRDTALAKVQELRDLIESMYGTMPPAHIKKWPNIMGRAKAEFQAAKNDRNERQK